MDGRRKKKRTMIKEQIFDICCLIASYVILFFLPKETTVLFYLIFGVSAFLFCIGFFRLGFTFDVPADSKEELVAAVLYTVFGVLINIAGFYGIDQDHGSGRSIVIATLLLIEALVLFAMAAGSIKAPGPQSLTAVVFRTAAALLVVFGVIFLIRTHISESSVIIATMLLIESICLWKMGGGSNPFNTLNAGIQTVPGLRIPTVQLQQSFAGVETQLGYPWIGKIRTIKQDSIIYGPSADGFYIYGYYLFGRFYIAGSTNSIYLDPEEASEHTLTEVPDSNGVLLAEKDLPEAYVKMFTRYAESGNAQWITEHADHAKSTGAGNGY